jgi:DNA-directed RNA polymerase specialized sigma24 family protein
VLNAMTPRQREICCLYFVQGMDQVDIAEMMGISQQAVSRLLTRAGDALEARGYPRLKRFQPDSNSRHQMRIGASLLGKL